MPGEAVLVTPLTGPLARFGRAGATALSIWSDLAGVGLEVIDSHPSAARAIRQATARRALVVFGPYGSGPAVEAGHAATTPFWNHGGATERLDRARCPHAINVPVPASGYLAGVLDAVDPVALGGRTALVVHTASGFGQEVADGATRAAARLGLDVVDVPFDKGAGGDAATRAESEAADVLLVAGSFEDEVAVAERLLSRPWAMAAFVAAGVDEILRPLGARIDGLYGPCQWLADTAPDPVDGPGEPWFSAAYEDAAGTSPPYPAAAAFAAGVLWQRCVDDAGTTDVGAVADAARRLDTTTLFGRFRLDPATGLQVGHRVGVVQWRGGRRVPI